MTFPESFKHQHSYPDVFDVVVLRRLRRCQPEASVALRPRLPSAQPDADAGSRVRLGNAGIVARKPSQQEPRQVCNRVFCLHANETSPQGLFFIVLMPNFSFLTTLDHLLKLSLGGFHLRFGPTGYLSRHVLRPHSFPHSSSAFSLFFVGFFFFCTPLRKPHLYRLAFESQEAPQYYQNPREASSSHSSPFKTLPRPPRDPRSMPPTPVMTRNAYSSSQLRCDHSSPALLSSPSSSSSTTSPQLSSNACLPPANPLTLSCALP